MHQAGLRTDNEASSWPGRGCGKLVRARTSRRDLQTAARHDALASSAKAAAAFYARREQTDQALAADRADWEKSTARPRQQAVLADAELRRRHPHTPLPVLRSAEPAPLPDDVPAVTATPGSP